MYKDQHNRTILTAEEVFDLLYNGKLKTLRHIYVENSQEIENYISSVNQNKDQFALPKTANSALIDYKKTWLIPKKYQNFDIALWLLEQCQKDIEFERVAEELELYTKYDLIPVLTCIKYLVDTMREHDIVWGVGRGSSVSSYCLYLIGLHKIDSIKYDLDIQEFFKEKINDQKNL